MREITKKDIDSIPEYKKVWDLGNEVLYELCLSHPAHICHHEIVAKVWLIGRSYAASIERRKSAKGEVGDDFYERVVAPRIEESEIDSWLASIQDTDEPGGARAIEVHSELMRLFREITGLDKRSLASKYLHFHKRNAFFIFDSRASNSIRKVTPRLDHISPVETHYFDREYRDFVRRCLWLRNHVQERFEQTLEPREIDKLLLMIAEEAGM